MGRRVFVSGSRAYTFAARRRRRDSQIDAFQRECSGQRGSLHGDNSAKNGIAPQLAKNRNTESTESHRNKSGNRPIVPSGTATPMQVWELMLFFRIPHDQAIAHSYEQASSLLGRLSTSQKQALVKQAQGSAQPPHGNAAVDRARRSMPPRARHTDHHKSSPRSKQVKPPKKVATRTSKRYIVPIRFHVTVEARSGALGRSAGLKSAKRFLKNARASRVMIEMASIVSERAVGQPVTSKKTKARTGRR